ncbi:HAD-superfamily hydrolase, subfamily IA, variant 1 [Thermocrinis albus DSM 14484]|uniref:phosphoglycolate phosphatase n=1 Tax=Thermocrinis albus (strain DSM 14484 / JCM 11386 / HI 11/12) TaxID=638303 RepID=D3SPZ5_THEAH|nr:HAD family hydrolase [Thermocrinis albus]ADC89232.1 HAD-superfamily hydrolase, subfamily IA, variant 1 [Thermocrinis albus DSM 14484]
MRKGLIFDVDGVLVDVSESYHHAIKMTAEYFLGKEVDLEVVRKIKFEKGINNDWLATKEVLLHFGMDVDLERIIDKFNEIYRLLRDRERPILPRDTLERFKAEGFPLAILTGRPREDLRYFMERFGMEDLFDVVIDDDELHPDLKKPHPYALHYCLELMDVDGAVYVGDSLADYTMVRDYRRLYEKPVLYIHFGDRVVPANQRVVKTPAELEEALREALLLL